MDDRTERQPDELEEANARLRASLKQCRDIVSDYRSKIAKAKPPRQADGEDGKADG